MNINPLRGEVWIVDLDPIRGHEQAHARPCLVVSHDHFNQTAAHLAVVIPITSQYHKISWFVPVVPGEGGLKKTSYIACNHVRTVSLERFGAKALGAIGLSTMLAVEARLRVLLDL
jgi:mRNA interferase MazF